MPQSLTTLQSTALGPVLTVSGVSPTVAVTTTAYPGSATAANPAGGQTITVTGTGFNAGVKVYVGSTICTTTYVSATSLTFTSPANSVGSYVLYVYNTDGTNGVNPAGITYSAVPVWVTAAGALTSASLNVSYSTSVSATGDNIVYSVTSGSLPTGLSLNASTGAITGTPTVEATSTFSITATDAQNQGVARSFSIAVNSVVSAVEYLVVAGGGGGGTHGSGYYSAGGGGAGGYRTNTGFAVSAGSPITVTVGAGGAGSTNSSVAGVNGFDSVFGSITSTGGGGGGSETLYSDPNGQSGGSGGGSAAAGGSARSGGLGNTPSTTPSQGNNGGQSAPNGYTVGAGGGGAGAVGQNSGAIAGASNPGGNGGTGTSSSISGSSVTYAGGGGGTGYIGGTGGTGGGGNGWGAGGPSAGPAQTATDGTVNTGGGGGGNGSTGGTGKAGGSGIVIIRYADTYPAATSTTGSPTITVAGGYRVYKFTASGSITF